MVIWNNHERKLHQLSLKTSMYCLFACSEKGIGKQERNAGPKSVTTNKENLINSILRIFILFKK